METWLTENAIYFLAVIGTVFSFFWLRSFREVLKLPAPAVLAAAAAFSALEYLFAKVFAVIEYMDFSAFGRMSLFGAVFFMPAAVFAAAKLTGISFPLLMDISSPCIIFLFMCGRVNCLITGCCYGVYLTASLRWPVREAEIAFYLIILIVFCLRLKKGKYTGTNYAVFLISYGVFRFAAEFVRFFPDQDGLWHKGHLCAAISFAAGLVWYGAVKLKKPAASDARMTG